MSAQLPLEKVKPFRTTSDRVRVALRKRFCQPEWNLFFEVRDATGFGGSRSADAVAMNCYPSRGLEICGFEIKVSRGDWLSELRSPAKSEPVQSYCDRWWIVAPADVVRVDELPVTWGMYEVTPRHELRVARDAPILTPVPITRTFVASMMRGAVRAAEAEIAEAVAARATELQERIDKLVSDASDAAQVSRYEAFQKIAAIKEATGIDLSSWTPAEDWIALLKMVQQGGVTGRHGLFAEVLQDLESSAKRVRAAMKSLGIEQPQKGTLDL